MCGPEAVSMILLECKSVGVVSLTNAVEGLPRGSQDEVQTLSSLASLAFCGPASFYFPNTAAHAHRGFLPTPQLMSGAQPSGLRVCITFSGKTLLPTGLDQGSQSSPSV